MYKLAPYEEIDKTAYEEFAAKMPQIDFASIVAYEREDETAGAKELACVSGVCEVDLGVNEPAAVFASAAEPQDKKSAEG